MGWAARYRQQRSVMKRVLVFDKEKGKTFFNLCLNGFITGGNQPGSDGRPVVVDRNIVRQRSRVMRAFKAYVGKDENLDEDKLPLTIRLDESDFVLLGQYIDKTPWNVQVSEDLSDLFDFLTSAPSESDK